MSEVGPGVIDLAVFYLPPLVFIIAVVVYYIFTSHSVSRDKDS
jgi:hypothetical protein